MYNHEKGLLYEKQVKNFIIQYLDRRAYLWNECPEDILIQYKLIKSHNEMRLIRKDIKEGFLHSHKDIGIDIVQLDEDNCSIVQCKNGYRNGLCIADLAGIMYRIASSDKDKRAYIYYTDSLSRNIRNVNDLSENVIYIDWNNDVDKTKLTEDSSCYSNKIYFVKLPYGNIEDMEDIEDIEDIKIAIAPYTYQTEAVSKFKEYFQSNNRGILSLPCGCGKTYASYLISKNYKHIIILSPLREFASQNLKRYIEYGYCKTNTILVDSDGIRDIDSIKEFIRNKNELLISCTYNSMDLIEGCLDMFNDALFIIDEFHNLSRANISNEENNIFKLLNSNHKILFMSATPRIYEIEYDDEYNNNEFFGDVVYQMTFTDAIYNKYITDYRIWLPSVHENNEELNTELCIYDIDNEIKSRCTFLYSCIANNGSQKCIVYCIDTDDMNLMMESMKILNDFYVMDIDISSISCGDSEKNRKSVLESFANNNDKIQLLFNIRILNECIDIPSCDSVYISYAPKNKITTIQRISRATRIDKNNPYKMANVYIWCEEYEEILETLSCIKEYDIMFKDKVKINVVDFYNNRDINGLELIEKDKITINEYIIGIKEFKVMSWSEKLAIIEEYIEQLNKLPSQHSKDTNIKSLGSWISNQKTNYKKNEHIMRNENIRKEWKTFIEKYPHLFLSNEEIWSEKLAIIEEYIQQHNELPSSEHKNMNIKSLGKWISHQKENYKKMENLMKNEEIRKEWETFIEKYPHLFLSNEENWFENKNKVEEYIQQHDKLPSQHSKDTNIKSLGLWISTQKNNYKKMEHIMKNEDIRIEWKTFIDKYPHLFLSNEENWFENKNKVEEYIQQHNELPSQHSKDTNIKSLGLWISTQKKNYKKNVEIMNNEEIRKGWESLIEKYPHLFLSNEENWFENKNKVEEYIEILNKLPSENSKDTNIKSLGSWISNQKNNYKKMEQIMKNEEIRKEWKTFIEKYPHLFLSNEENWFENKNKVEEYIQQHNELPSKHKDMNIKSLGVWISNQKKNYKKMEQIMKNEEIRNEWETFIEKYHHLFLSNEEIWFENKNKVEEYIEQLNKLPSQHSKDTNIKSLGQWISTQKNNYKKIEQIMNNEEIRKEWEAFIEKYHRLFQ
jgi:superfamily II DNA or RNA helicase